MIYDNFLILTTKSSLEILNFELKPRGIMNNFEVTLLISPELTANNLKKAEEVFTKLLKDNDGELIQREDWGLRDISFKIKSFKKAFYSFFQIKMPGSKLENIKKILNQNEQIIRYLFVKVEEHESLPTKLSKETE